MSTLDRKNSKPDNIELKTMDFGGFGDCGYRAIFGAFLLAHEAKQLSQAQYQSLGLQDLLQSLSVLGKAYLSSNFTKMSSVAQLSELMQLFKTSKPVRNQLIIDGAEALRKVSVKNLHASPRFSGFVVRDESTLPGQDADLKKNKAEKGTTYISAAEIASASEVLHIPIAIQADVGLKTPEVYNATGSQVPALNIELSKAHYTAKVSAEVVNTLTRPHHLPTATALINSLPFLTSVIPDSKQNQKNQELDVEQTYRNQREVLKTMVSDLSTQELSHLVQSNQKDDYLGGNHRLDTKNKENLIHLIATAAWKNPGIAQQVLELLSKTNAKSAQAFQAQIKQQENESIAAFQEYTLTP